MKSLKQYINEGLEVDLIGLLKTFGAGDIEIDEETMSTRLRHKQQVWDIIARLPAWTDYDVFVYEINPATAGKHLENPAGTDNAGIPFDHEGESESDNTYTDDEIGYEDLTDQFHEYELVVYLFNTESEMVEEEKSLDEATMYNVNGKNVSKKEMLSAATAKEVVSISGKIVYHAVMSEKGDSASVFKITKKEFDKLNKKDITSDKMKKHVAAETAKKMAKQLDMRDAVMYNGWARKNKPSDEQKIEYLKKEFGLSEAVDKDKKKEKKKKDDIEAAEADQGQDTSTAGTDAEYESIDWSETDIGPLTELWDLKAAEKAGMDYKAKSAPKNKPHARDTKTIKMVNKVSGKEIVVTAKSQKKYEKLGFKLQESTLTERRRIVKVNARGQRRIKIKCKPGYKYAGGKCVKITGSEKTKKRRSIKKAVRTKRQKGAGFQRRVQRLRKRAMKKRKSMGLNSGFDIQAKQPKTHKLRQGHEPEGTSLAEGRTYKNNAKIDTKKTEVVYKVPSKDGKSTFVVVYVENPKGAGTKDKYEMYTVDKGFNVVLSHGTHPSLSGAKKFAKSKGLVSEEVEQVDEARYPKGKYGAKARGNAKAQWMRTYEQEINNRKDAEGMAGKIDWNVATHHFFMGTDAKVAAQTVKSPYKK